ncbi:hypothetical protein O1611_g2913 [Lasiodiplodia mahajangana]|uniref:Uncharacterized protein n=1 Tax=Lasiodiplodia mahajangana TaxID=1108764 RepID=A0ACC2JT78_9PEZI|nr:hypothetical protein O1611_g2913 [Lasiodiplodia mahajangana]
MPQQLYSFFSRSLKDFKTQLVADLLQQSQPSQTPPTNNVPAAVILIQPPPIMPMIAYGWYLCHSLAGERSSTVMSENKNAVVYAQSDPNAKITATMRHISPSSEKEKMGFVAPSSQLTTQPRSDGSTFASAHESRTRTQRFLSTLSHLCGLLAMTMGTPGI